MKIAQRIILELKNKLKGFEISGEEVASAETGQGEAVEALVALGYSPELAKKAVSAADGNSVEDIVKNALKSLF